MSSPSGPRYTRISITTQEDTVKKLLPLIYEYVKFPERAATVKEVVFDAAVRRGFRRNGDEFEADKEREAGRAVALDATLERAIRLLGVDESQAARWHKQLTWMAPEVQQSRQYRSAGNFAFDTQQNSLFAQHAGAILLLLCPNIEKLVYVANGGPAKHILLHNNYGALPGRHLQRLNHLHLVPRDGFMLNDDQFYAAMDISSLVRLFHRLLSLSSITTEAITVNGDAGWRPTLPPGTSPATELKLSHVDLPTSVTASLIRLCSRLEVLSITTGGKATVDGGHYPHQPRVLQTALDCHRDTLRAIHLDLDQHYPGSDAFSTGKPEYEADLEELKSEADHYRDNFSEQDDEDTHGPLFPWEINELEPFEGVLNLRNFVHLTHLSTGIMHLLAAPVEQQRWGTSHNSAEKFKQTSMRLLDALPPSLEVLTVLGYERGREPSHDAEIGLLLQHRAERLPLLKLIEGIDQLIPSGKNVDRPDHDYDKLWQPDQIDMDGLRQSNKRMQQLTQYSRVQCSDKILLC